MFSLVLSLIAAGVIAAVVFVTVSHMKDSFNEAGGDATSDGYLKTVPEGDWSFAEDSVHNTSVSDNICRQINKRLYDDPAIPDCSATTHAMGCCSTGS